MSNLQVQDALLSVYSPMAKEYLRARRTFDAGGQCVPLKQLERIRRGGKKAGRTLLYNHAAEGQENSQRTGI